MIRKKNTHKDLGNLIIFASKRYFLNKNIFKTYTSAERINPFPHLGGGSKILPGIASKMGGRGG